jgi:hypothetical protein
MVNMTLAIPEELSVMMKKHAEIKWSEVARQAMWEHAKKLELMDRLASKSRLTSRDLEEIGRKVKEGIARSHCLK